MSAPATTRRTRKTPARPARTLRLPRITWGGAIALGITLAAVAKTWPIYTGLAVALAATITVLTVVRPRRLNPLIHRATAIATAIQARRAHLPAPGQRTLAAFQRMNPTQFEQATTALAQEDTRVAHAQHTGRTADRGIDTLVTLHTGHRILVQCKHHRTGKKVGGDTVREIVGSVLANGCHAGVIVTTTGFTAEALATNTALGRNALALIDGAALEQWANGGHAPW